jgi:CCAAT-binding transcription factor (CBF-B/NF-YA) subunit B
MLTIVQEFCEKLVSYYIDAGYHKEVEKTPGSQDPFYINAKQYHRVLKRRVTRMRLEEYFKHKSESSQANTSTNVKNKRRRSPFRKSKRDSVSMQKPSLVNSASESEE